MEPGAKKTGRPRGRHPHRTPQRMITKAQRKAAGGWRPQPKKQQQKVSPSPFLLLHSHGERGSRGKEEPKVCLPLRCLASSTPRGSTRSKERAGFKCLSQSTVAQLRSQAPSPAAAGRPKRQLLTCGSHSLGCFSSRCCRRCRRCCRRRLLRLSL